MRGGKAIKLKKEKTTTSKPLFSDLKRWSDVFPFIIVGMILLLVFVLYPLYKNILMSFTEYNILTNETEAYIGIENYMRAFGDPKVKLAFENTLLYGIMTVPLQMLFGLMLASLINSKIKGRLFFRVLYYIPVITSWIVVSLVFRYLFQSSEAGLINYVLMSLGFIKEPIAWLGSRWTANTIIWVLGIWKGIGWVMIIYLAAIQGINKHLYEAASIDGANTVQKFWSITVPSVKPVTYFILVNLLIGSFNVFIQVLVITNGGPMGRTEVLLSYMYKVAFSNFEFGYSSAIAVLMGILIFTITSFQKKFFSDAN